MKNSSHKFKNFVLFLFIVSISLFFNSCNSEKQDITIVPEPVILKQEHGFFKLDQSVSIYSEQATESIHFSKEFLQKEIESRSGIKLEISDTKTRFSQIELDLNPDLAESLGNEGYYLNIGPKEIKIEGASEAGIFYGIQSLIQLIPIQNAETIKLQSLHVEDFPRFEYRGMHLDVCRHFFDVDFVKKYIDFIAMHKMNTFHWHLTEDQGWRIEIKKYPKLTEIGSKRIEKDGSEYAGYYTQEEIKEIVNYAKDRHITVIPEIEMPGHSLAALAAYPNLSCSGGPFKVANEWGVFHDVYCAGKEETFEFLENVLMEVIELFPSEYIHIGGDESPKTRWEKCPDCQKRIKEEGLKDEHELQSYFIQRMEKFLLSKGRKIIGWDEILEGGLAPEATVMSWRGISGGIAAAKQGHDAIMTPGTHCYFDHYQGDADIEPKAIGGFTDLEKVYSYEPVPEELTEKEAKHILGAQANLWTEYIATNEYAEYMVLPRMSALAEVLWSPKEKRDWDKFQNKLPNLYAIYEMMNANYHVPIPGGLYNKVVYVDKALIEFRETLKGSEIRYSLDGSDPDENAMLYTLPFEVTEDITIKAVNILSTGKKSQIRTIQTEKRDFEAGVEIDSNDLENGVKAFYFEGKFSTCNNFFEKFKKESVEAYFTIPEDQLNDNFAYIFETNLYIEKDGIYAFQTGSDDGSVLLLNDILVVDNDGLHGYQKEMGQIPLKKGFHHLKVKYFDRTGSNYLRVYMKSPGGEMEKIPEEALFIKK